MSSLSPCKKETPDRTLVCLFANSVASVSPIYYVTFTTAVLAASFTLFQGFNVTDEIKSMSLLCGFLTVFTGVYLLNFNGSNTESPNPPIEYELASRVGSPLSGRTSLQGSITSGTSVYT